MRLRSASRWQRSHGCGNVKKRAAAILGISLKTLYNRLEGYSQREGSDVEGRRPDRLITARCITISE
jgi:hypothetical protein